MITWLLSWLVPCSLTVNRFISLVSVAALVVSNLCGPFVRLCARSASMNAGFICDSLSPVACRLLVAPGPGATWAVSGAARAASPDPRGFFLVALLVAARSVSVSPGPGRPPPLAEQGFPVPAMRWRALPFVWHFSAWGSEGVAGRLAAERF